MPTLSVTQIQSFIENGYCCLEGAIDPLLVEQALTVLHGMFEREGVVFGPGRAISPKAVVSIRKNFDDPEFQSCLTPRLASAIEQLVGEGVWDRQHTQTNWGSWIGSFGPHMEPWQVPDIGWHWDPFNGPLALCYFSPVERFGGGTMLAAGSHLIVAKHLLSRGVGIEGSDAPLSQYYAAIDESMASHPWLEALADRNSPLPSGEFIKDENYGQYSERDRFFLGQTWIDPTGVKLRVVESTANAGDIYLCHPLLLHARSSNQNCRTRILCNLEVPLKSRTPNLNPSRQRSPLELSLIIAARL
jgi:hypothetical protein